MQTEQTNQYKVEPKKVAIFNIKPLTNAVSRARATPKREKETFKTKVKKKLSPLEEKYKNVPIVGDNYVFAVEMDSIKQFLNHCHPDVRSFIDHNEFSSIKATPHELVVVTRNRFRMVIKNISKTKNEITITGKKRELIYSGTSEVSFKDEKSSTKVR